MAKKSIILMLFILSCTYDNIYCPRCPSYQSPSFTIHIVPIHSDTLIVPFSIDLIPNDTINYLNYYRYKEVGFEWTSWSRSLMSGNYYIMFSDKDFVIGLNSVQIQTCYDTINGEVFDTTITFFVKGRRE